MVRAAFRRSDVSVRGVSICPRMEGSRTMQGAIVEERKLCKLSNSGAIACVSRLDLDHFEYNLIRPDLIRGSLAEIG